MARRRVGHREQPAQQRPADAAALVRGVDADRVDLRLGVRRAGHEREPRVADELARRRLRARGSGGRARSSSRNARSLHGSSPGKSIRSSSAQRAASARRSASIAGTVAVIRRGHPLARRRARRRRVGAGRAAPAGRARARRAASAPPPRRGRPGDGRRRLGAPAGRRRAAEPPAAATAPSSASRVDQRGGRLDVRAVDPAAGAVVGGPVDLAAPGVGDHEQRPPGRAVRARRRRSRRASRRRAPARRARRRARRR